MLHLYAQKKKSSKLPLFLLLASIPVGLLLLHFGYQKYLTHRYPLKYTNYVEKYANENQLPQPFVYAVIKCESGFNPNAVSHVNARGLMQLTEETFDWVKSLMLLEGLPEENTTYADLFNPETNIKYGTFLLHRLLEEFQNPVNVLCAYHAGRSRVHGWLADPQYSSDGKVVTNIPIAATETYVGRVLEAEATYTRLYFKEETASPIKKESEH